MILKKLIDIVYNLQRLQFTTVRMCGGNTLTAHQGSLAVPMSCTSIPPEKSFGHYTDRVYRKTFKNGKQEQR
jgi:hypothetical protein